MIDPEHKLSVARQAKLLGFSRGSLYYLPRPVSDGDLALMRRICIAAIEEALARYGKPDIFNTVQGSQFTSMDVTAVLKKAEIAISIDGKGAGQRLRRAALVFDQIRGGLPPCLQDRIRGPRRRRPLSDLLQYSTPTFIP